MEKVILCWSGGKDCSLALHELLCSGRYSVAGILTTVTEDFDRISMHGVRSTLLDKQAEALNLILEKVVISRNATNEEYEERMSEILTRLKDKGINTVAFGDIFLEDLRAYRESNLARIQMKAVFPLWKKDTASLARSFIDLGFKAIVSCVDTQFLDACFTGREFDGAFLEDLPSSVDPCGENGEFHTFVYAGPIFEDGISFSKGEIVLRNDRFCFCDLVPTGASS